MSIRKFLAILLALAFAAAPAEALAKRKGKRNKYYNMNKRIEMLEQEVQDLKAQQEELKQQPQSAVTSKYPLEVYGFVAAQVFWGSTKTRLYTANPTNATAAQSSVLNANAGASNNNSWLSFSVQNSRIGLNWTGSQVGNNIYMGGKVELDFLNVYNNLGAGTSPIPRIRHIYMDFWGSEKDFKKWAVLAGQTWDIFSPLNTKSLSLGGNLWFQGNLGFRRPQIRFTYQHRWSDKNIFKVAVAATHPANTDDLINNSGIDSGIPYGELLLQYNRNMKYGDLVIAASGTAGRQRRGGATWATMFGVAGSINVPVHKFLQISGEIQYGQDLGNFLTYAGTGLSNRNLCGWAQISSRWHNMFETNLGFGIDNIDKANIAAGTGPGNINRNQNYYANFKLYPFKSFYWGVEYNYMRTGYIGNGTSDASIVFTNLVYSF